LLLEFLKLHFLYKTQKFVKKYTEILSNFNEARSSNRIHENDVTEKKKKKTTAVHWLHLTIQYYFSWSTPWDTFSRMEARPLPFLASVLNGD
jgi:hypothetical protein